MKNRLLRIFVVVLSVLVIGTGFVNAQHGSFTVQLDVLTPDLTILLEQQVTEVGGWRVYAGTGFAVVPFQVVRLDPYTLACRELDMLRVYSELCIETKLDLMGQEGFELQTFWTTTW